MALDVRETIEVKHQRAIGEISVSVRSDDRGFTQLEDLRQAGSMRAVFPRPSREHFEAVVLNTAGGVTGGDDFATTLTVGNGAKLSLTTQAAERIYRAVNDVAGQIQNTLTLAQDAQIYWLPQETILFDGCQLERRLNVDLTKTSRFLMLEPLVFGREASGENLTACAFSDRVNISCDGQPVYIDGIDLRDDVFENMKRSAVGNANRALANIVLFDRDAAQLLDGVRALLPALGGASLLADNLLVVRILSQDSYELRKTLLPLLTLLTHDAVPKNWRL